MIVDVLGLGESLKQFKPTCGHVTVGVNDIFKYHPVDYLVVVDPPRRFTKERMQTIVCSNPQKFYTMNDEWRSLVTKFQKLNLGGPKGCIKNIEGKTIPYSNNSTFIAVVIAYKLGAKEINVYGVDFNTHPNFRSTGLETALRHFKQLFSYLKSKGVKINISKGSRLNELT